MTNIDFSKLKASNEPQDISVVGSTPYEYLFAKEGKAFIKKVKKLNDERSHNV